MSRLRAENRVRQRERILAAAFDLFAEQAFADVTVTEVAAAAEVSRATVFNHFRSKQGLIDAITEKVLLYYREMLDAALADEESPTPALLRAMFDQMGAGIENQRSFQRGIFREIAQQQLGFDEGGLTQRANEENHARLERLIARGQKRGDLDAVLPAVALAAALTDLANGTITRWLFEETSESLQLRMQLAAEIFLCGAAPDARTTDPSLPLPDLNPTPAGVFESWPPRPSATTPSTRRS